MPHLSIVIPVYNEEESLPHLLDAIDAFTASFEPTVEVLYVDDGSSDRTQELLREALKTRPGQRMLVFRANRGQTAAMAAGLAHAKGERIVFMDADLQNDPADIPLLLDTLEQGYDLVSGWRRDRKDRKWSRTVPSMMANRIIGWVTGVKVHDYGCTLKVYRARVVKPLRLYADMHRFLPALCSSTGARVTEVVVTHHPRRAGSSKYGLDRIFKVIADLTVIKLIVTFSGHPMHYFGLLSLGSLAIALLALALRFGQHASGWGVDSVVVPALTLLFFCSALWFLFLGLLADLIVHVRARELSRLARAGMEVIP